MKQHPQASPQLVEEYLARQALRRVGDYALLIKKLTERVSELEDRVKAQAQCVSSLNALIHSQRACIDHPQRTEKASTPEPQKPSTPRGRPTVHEVWRWPSRPEAIAILRRSQTFAALRDACIPHVHMRGYIPALITHYWIADKEWIDPARKQRIRPVPYARKQLARIVSRAASMNEVAAAVAADHSTVTVWCARLGIRHPNRSHPSHQWWEIERRKEQSQ